MIIVAARRVALDEVDFVIESAAGEIVGIEVKAAWHNRL
jgi:hypothetical protein